MKNRREFLKQSSLIAMTPMVPGYLANFARVNQPKSDDRVLVVIQLDGGNDGVNTLVPFKDEGYKKHRKNISLAPQDLLKLDEQLGLNPGMRNAASLWEAGQLALVPSVGYPNPNRSHGASMAIWQTCQFKVRDQNSHGWLGLSMDQKTPDPNGAPISMYIGKRQQPIAIQGRKNSASSLSNIRDFVMPAGLETLDHKTSPANANDIKSFLEKRNVEAFNLSSTLEGLNSKADNSARYPGSRLASNLRMVSQLLKSGFGTRIFYTAQGGYDTHANQLRSHSALLSDLSGALKAFLDDLKSAKLDDRVLVLCFSEFGRRVDENGSLGTDHGAGGLVMLVGSQVQPGIHGPYSSLLDLDDGALRVQTDFRSVYSSVLSQWLDTDPQKSVHGPFDELSLVKS